jgi:hypothetical protein
LFRVLLAGIKNLGNHPCPRCLVHKSQIGELGTKRDDERRVKQARIDNEHRQHDVDLARSFMFTRGDGPTSTAVENVLDAESRVPTRVSVFSSSNFIIINNIQFKNTFSQRFLPFGFNYYSMLVVDFLHEFELGVWKAILSHLIRILYAIGNNAVATLDQWFASKFPINEIIHIDSWTPTGSVTCQHLVETRYASFTTMYQL